MSADEQHECWRCLGPGASVPIDGISWRKKGETELRPALLCPSCAKRRARITDTATGRIVAGDPVKVEIVTSDPRQLDMWGES